MFFPYAWCASAFTCRAGLGSIQLELSSITIDASKRCWELALNNLLSIDFSFSYLASQVGKELHKLKVKQRLSQQANFHYFFTIHQHATILAKALLFKFYLPIYVTVCRSTCPKIVGSIDCMSGISWCKDRKCWGLVLRVILKAMFETRLQNKHHSNSLAYIHTIVIFEV